MNGEHQLGDVTGSEPGAGPSPWGYRHFLGLAAIGVVSQIVVQVLAMEVVERLGVPGGEDFAALLRKEPLVTVPIQLLSWVPPLAYVAYVVSIECRLPVAVGIAWAKPPKPTRSYVRTGVLLGFGSLLMSSIIGDPDQQSPMQDLFANRESLWILVLFGVVVAPVFEEVVFRGFLYGSLDRMHGTSVALIATSIVFSGLHGAQYGWQWQQLVILTAVGLAFGVVRMKSGSAKASAIMHASYNGLLFLVAVSLPVGLG